jgi:hypothetical protein
MMAEITEGREHIDGADCWCHPDLILEGWPGVFGDVWVHKGDGEELAPAWVIADAIASAFISDDG